MCCGDQLNPPPKAEASPCCVMPLRFVVTHLTGSPRRGLSEGDKVPISKFSADIVSSLRGVNRDTFTPCWIDVGYWGVNADVTRTRQFVSV